MAKMTAGTILMRMLATWEAPMAGAHARRTGRPGVVHLGVPEHLIHGSHEVDGPLWPPSTCRSLTPMPPEASQLVTLTDLLTAAERPLLHEEPAG